MQFLGRVIDICIQRSCSGIQIYSWESPMPLDRPYNSAFFSALSSQKIGVKPLLSAYSTDPFEPSKLEVSKADLSPLPWPVVLTYANHTYMEENFCMFWDKSFQSIMNHNQICSLHSSGLYLSAHRELSHQLHAITLRIVSEWLKFRMASE